MSMVSNPFSKLFGQSPIRPIQIHIEKAHECACQLLPFIQATLQDDWKLAGKVQKKISKLENDADDLKKHFRMNLSNSLMMPVDRSDLLVLITRQDKIANYTKDIAGIMLGRKMRFPDEIAPAMLDYIKVAIATSEQAVKAIHEMDELLEVGFRGHVVKIVQSLVEELDKLEHNNDELQVQVRAQLFQLESELPAVDVMFLYKVIDWIGELADSAQSVGARLQLLIAK